MHPHENADPEVVTSAPPAADLEATWDGVDRPERDGKSERIAALEALLENAQHREREQRARADAFEAAARVQAEAHQGALAGMTEARARIAAIEADLERARGVIATGLDAVSVEDLLDAIQRKIDAAYPAPMGHVASAAVLICRDDAGDHARENVAE
jgi:hypothetical protein